MKASNVLVIEDNELVRLYIQKVLKFKGLKTKGAESGEEGLEILNDFNADLILCDIILPGIDGYEVCRILKNNDKTRDIPVIFLSALTQSKEIVRGFELGIVDYITKPFNDYELMSRVMTHLDLKISRDIIESQRKELSAINNRLDKQNHELKRLNETKDKIFSIFSHDLRGPIGSFQNVIELLGDEELFSQQEKTSLLEEMKNQAKNIFTMLENLLQWSISQRGEINFVPSMILLYEELKGDLSILNVAAENKQIKLEIEINPDLKILADKDILSLIIRNLISNAIKFTPEKGKVSLIVTESDEEIEFEIKDTGIGMSLEHSALLFKKESYTTSRGTNNEKGTGLGLNLCDEFVEKHGGRIWVESEKGKGSSFKFVIKNIKK